MATDKWCMKHLRSQPSTSFFSFFIALLDHAQEQDESSRRLLAVWCSSALRNSSSGTALYFSSCNHLHGSWHMTVIFELIVPIGACSKQMWPKCRFWGRMFFNECILLCSSHAFVKTVHIRKKLSTQIHRTYLWPFPVSSVINRFLKWTVQKGDEEVACSQHLCKSDCWCMYRPILCFLVTQPFSPLCTFSLPDFILPRKVRSHLKFLQCPCEWLNICPSNVLISPQLINTLVSCSLKPQVPLKFWFSWLRTDEEKCWSSIFLW